MKATHSQRFGFVSRNLAIAGALVLATPLPPAPGQDGRPTPLLPSSATYRGRRVADWCFLADQVNISNGLGGQDLPDSIDGVRILPGAFVPSSSEFDIDLGVQTGIVSTPWFVFGELYDDGTYDDPAALAEFLEVIFETTYIDTRLDGRTLLQGQASDLAAYGYGPRYFDQPIDYTEPIERGEDLYAVAALWTMGIGSFYVPLSPGRHTLTYVVDSDFFGLFEYTYNITVGPPWSRPGNGPYGSGASD